MNKMGRKRNWIEPSDKINFNIKKITTLKEIEQTYVLMMIDHFHNNKIHAARALGVSIKGLYCKLYKWGVLKKKNDIADEVW